MAKLNQGVLEQTKEAEDKLMKEEEQETKTIKKKKLAPLSPFEVSKKLQSQINIAKQQAKIRKGLAKIQKERAFREKGFSRNQRMIRNFRNSTPMLFPLTEFLGLNRPDRTREKIELGLDGKKIPPKKQFLKNPTLIKDVLSPQIAGNRELDDVFKFENMFGHEKIFSSERLINEKVYPDRLSDF